MSRAPAFTVETALDEARQHFQAERFAEAETCCRALLALHPNDGGALNLLGVLATRAGQFDIALSLFRRILALNPNSAATQSNLAHVLQETGRFEEAIVASREAIRLQPDNAGAHNNLGVALQAIRKFDEAADAYRNSIRLQAENNPARRNLENILDAPGEIDAAIEARRAVLRNHPRDVDTLHALGNDLRNSGRLDEAIATFREALRIDPDHAEAQSSLLLAALYHPDSDDRTILAACCEWAHQHAKPFTAKSLPHAKARDASRRLRIGYVSQDFRAHVAHRTILALLRAHDRTQFEIYGYASVAQADVFTEECRRQCDQWRDVVNASDDEAAEIIRRDQIDILVDLSAHTARHRLLVFARKPAPVQASYLAYCGTTGMSAMDYRLSDPFLDPPDADLACSTEQTLRLPHSYWFYEPFAPTPEVAIRPIFSEAEITFGCLSDFVKVSTVALDLWARILAAVPRSRLLLQAPAGSSRKAIVDRFAQHGVRAERLDFVGYQPWTPYMETFQRLDIALDPFPYAGGISSCDTLWMGVPVVTLSGQTAVGRGGRSILMHLGLPELVAETPERYVEIAVALAADRCRLHELRADLRQRLQKSPLMDAVGHTRAIEAAYRQMWANWCAQA